jgi:hypothetical protein
LFAVDNEDEKMLQHFLFLNKKKNKKDFSFCNKASLLTFIFGLYNDKHRQGKQTYCSLLGLI